MTDPGPPRDPDLSDVVENQFDARSLPKSIVATEADAERQAADLTELSLLPGNAREAEACLRKIADRCRGLTRLRYLCHETSDEALKQIGRLSGLKHLSLTSCAGLSPGGFKPLADLKELETLDLGNCRTLSDAMLAPLAGHENLCRVDLGLCDQLTDGAVTTLATLPRLNAVNLGLCRKLTEAAAKSLSRCASLRSISLAGVDLPDDAAADISNLEGLVSLELGADRITDAGLSHLAKLRHLRVLKLESHHLRQANIGDAGLEALSGLSRLEVLSLRGFKRIGDRGLFSLVSLDELRSLDLTGVRGISDDGVAALQLAQPKCTITR